MDAVQPPVDPSPSTSSSTSDFGISTLPDDVLHNIFVFSVSPDLPLAYSQILCSVSQHWRDIALAYSDLWRNVSCDLDNLFPSTQLLELWIERSHQAPVDISFKSWLNSAGATVEQRRDYLQRALEILLPHCHRWKKLAISIPFEQAKVFTGVTLSGAVELVTVEVNIDKANNPLMGVLTTAPSIKHLKWQTWELVWGDVRLDHRFPWEKLLRISLSYQHPWPETAQVVARCTSAKVMIVYVPIQIITTPFPPYIHLPNLRTLSIVGCDSELPLIGNLSSPQLSVLFVEIEGTGGKENTAICQLCAFLRSGKHNLRMLQVQIHNQWLTEEDARMILRASRELNLPSVDIYICFDPWGDLCSDQPSVDYSFLEKEFRGARIAAVREFKVVFGWLDLRAVDTFISEFSRVPDVDMAGVHPFFKLACPETMDKALKKKIKRALGLFPQF